MMIHSFTFEGGRDFHATMVCEHCGAYRPNNAGYHDSYYHTQVIPGMFCQACHRNRAGDAEPPAVPYEATR